MTETPTEDEISQQLNKKKKTKKGKSTEELEKKVLGSDGFAIVDEIEQSLIDMDEAEKLAKHKILSRYSGPFQRVLFYADKFNIYKAENLTSIGKRQLMKKNAKANTMIKKANRIIEQTVNDMHRRLDIKEDAGILIDRYHDRIDELDGRKEEMVAQYREEKKAAIDDKENTDYRNTRETIQGLVADVQTYDDKLRKAQRRFVREDNVIKIYNVKKERLKSKRNKIQIIYDANEDMIEVAKAASQAGISAFEILRMFKGSEKERDVLRDQVDAINKLEDEGSEVLNRTPDPEKTMYEVPKQVADYNARTDEALANAVQEIRQRDEKEIIF